MSNINQNFNELDNNAELEKYDTKVVIHISSKVERILRGFSKFTFEQRKKILERMDKTLFTIDIICLIINLGVVTALYFEHFTYVENQFILKDSNNITRIVCLFFSLLVCLLITFRYKSKCEHENLKFLQKIRNYAYYKSIEVKFLIFEIIPHIIQPYPYVSHTWIIMVLGTDITYSLNMILFCTSIARLYILIKILKTWMTYSNDKSRRIFKFYKNKNLYSFLYKSSIKAYGFYALSLIFAGFIYFFALYFKILENYTWTDLDSPDSQHSNQIFYYIWNALWYLVVTMTTIGYGDYYPVTLLGRLIGVFCCIVGIFLMSLIVVNLIFITSLDNDELSAYEEIDKNYDKIKKDNEYSQYYDTYIKYKAMKLARKNHDLNDLLLAKHKLDIKRESISCIIRSLNTKTYNIDTFNKECAEILDEYEYNGTSEKLTENAMNLINVTGEMIKKKDINFAKVKYSKRLNFQILNLVKLMSLVGNIVHIESINEIYGKTVIGNREIKLKYREFFLKFKNAALPSAADLKKEILNASQVDNIENDDIIEDEEHDEEIVERNQLKLEGDKIQ